MVTEHLQQLIEHEIKAKTGSDLTQAEAVDYFSALSTAVVSYIAGNWQKSRAKYAKVRQQHYFSAEFLVGRALLNNLINLNIYDQAKEALANLGQDINEILESENDPGLGNGGLGRLAACFMDSCACMNLPVNGYGILYRFGLFYQYFSDGFQNEKPNVWMEEGYPFTVAKPKEGQMVEFADLKLRAVPYDMPITGYNTANVNTIRLWRAEPLEVFDFHKFNDQNFAQAVAEKNKVEDICRVLYPNDSGIEGKTLRLRQQYFFVSASLQDILNKYILEHGNDFTKLPDYNCIQLNDTHPVIAIPELMRLLIDVYSLSWDMAWNLVSKIFAYTNHTILAEALEKWNVDLLKSILPRIYEIIKQIDLKFRHEMVSRNIMPDKIEYLAPISNNMVHMAWLACYTSYSINGVAALHTDILKKQTLFDWYNLYPERFSNKTNGVTPRRWLRMCNPELSALITKCLGSENWVSNLEDLEKLQDFVNDEKVLDEFIRIKDNKKQELVNFLKNYEGIDVPANAIFDVQIKRLHEYKRQLLNALYILDLYFRLKEEPYLIKTPRVFIFGAKAAPGYYRAKSIIKFINEIANLINNDADIQEKLKVVFVHNYSVSVAEKLFPASDISEQISTAGLEASGTGNMKFMMNGALTLGTLDGANIEIVEAVGHENAYIFGADLEELNKIKPNYNPWWNYENIPGLKRALDSLINSCLSDNNSGRFNDLYNNLLKGNDWEKADNYYVLGDFASYRETRDKMAADYENRQLWAKKCLINIAKSGRFSSDRTIRDYAEEIWKIKAEKI